LVGFVDGPKAGAIASGASNFCSYRIITLDAEARTHKSTFKAGRREGGAKKLGDPCRTIEMLAGCVGAWRFRSTCSTTIQY
jgi:hypothetical protein